MLNELSNSGLGTSKVRSTPPKEPSSASSQQDSKIDSAASNSETSSISGDGSAQEGIKERTELQNTVTSTQSCSSVDNSANETKENVNPHGITKTDNTNTTGKRKKPKSKIINYLYILYCCISKSPRILVNPSFVFTFRCGFLLIFKQVLTFKV